MRQYIRNRLSEILWLLCVSATLIISFTSGRRSMQPLENISTSSTRMPIIRQHRIARQVISNSAKAVLPGVNEIKVAAVHPLPLLATHSSSKQGESEFKVVKTNTDPSHKMVVLNKPSDLLFGMYLNPPCPACTFEPHLQRVMKNCLKNSKSSDSIFFDIGANIGIHALYMAASGYKVVAVEADSDTFELLSRSIAENRFFDRILAFNVAITSTQTEVEMIRNAENVGNNKIISVNNGTVDPSSGLHHTARGVKLDDLLPFLPVEKEIVFKIDIEGHECHVLNKEQATRLFSSRKIPCIAMEFTPKTMNVDRKCVEEMISLLTSLNYVPYFAVGSEAAQKVKLETMFDTVNEDILWIPNNQDITRYI